MRYGNAVVKEYPNFVNVSVFNRNIVDDTKLNVKIREDYSKDSNNHVRIDSVLRAKHKIFDIALLNKFEYFVTFTFNDKIVDAHDYKNAISKVKKWTNNQVNRRGLVYLLVPELHPSSGRIHLHGLLYWSDTPTLSESGHFDSSGRTIYNLPSWRFGFSTVIRLDDNQEAVAKYITKYITKELDKITGNFYYAGGHGLIRCCNTYYVNINYESFNGQEYNIDKFNIGCSTLKVKYNTYPVGSIPEILLGYEKIED